MPSSNTGPRAYLDKVNTYTLCSPSRACSRVRKQIRRFGSRCSRTLGMCSIHSHSSSFLEKHSSAEFDNPRYGPSVAKNRPLQARRVCATPIMPSKVPSSSSAQLANAGVGTTGAGAEIVSVCCACAAAA